MRWGLRGHVPQTLYGLGYNAEMGGNKNGDHAVEHGPVLRVYQVQPASHLIFFVEKLFYGSSNKAFLKPPLFYLFSRQYAELPVSTGTFT